jgi:hypothetical protein
MEPVHVVRFHDGVSRGGPFDAEVASALPELFRAQIERLNAG